MLKLFLFYLVSVVTGQNPWFAPQMPPQFPWSPAVQQFPWSPPVQQFPLSPAVQAPSHDDSWYDMGDDWEVSNHLMQQNPLYSTYRQMDNQMNMYAFAPHVGKINRGQFFNPELNMPGDRAYGYQHDFNPEDFQSGAFKSQPKGQQVRATQAHVNQGLASRVGDVATMPIGQHVQKDGSVLVQTSFRQKSPCNPNPCKDMSKCTVVNDFTAKCSIAGDYELTLRWTDPDDDNDENGLYFELVPALHDGSECPQLGGDSSIDYDEAKCGASMTDWAEADFDGNPYVAEYTATMTTVSDGTKYQDYTYAVFVYYDDDNLSLSELELQVIHEGEIEQTLSAPNFDGVTTVNDDWEYYYFFGCFRPYGGGYRLDTNGAGWYDDDSDDFVINGVDYSIYDTGLCKALLGWTGTPGFNPSTAS